MKRHLLSIDDLTRDDIERILGRAESFAEVSGREIKKVPTLRGRTVINLFYEASTRTSSSFEIAAKRLSADLVNVKSAGSSVDKGESLKDTVQTLSAYDPAAIVFRSPSAGAAGPGGALDARLGDQRRRRQARAPHPGAAGPVHPAPPPAQPGRAEGLDRRRRAAQPRRALEHPGLHADGLPGHGLRPADADPARGGGAGLRRQTHPGRARRGGRGLRAADAARADDRLVRAIAARVRVPVPDQLPPPGRRAAADAPGAGQPRGGAVGRGHRLAPGADHRAGAVRRGGADGRALRAAGRRPAAPRPRSSRSPSRHDRDPGPRPRAGGNAAGARGPPAGPARRPRRAGRHPHPRRPDRRPRRSPVRSRHPRVARWSRPRACTPSPPSWTRTCTCALPARSTRRTSRPAPAPPLRAASAPSWPCPTRGRWSTTPRSSSPCARWPRTRRAFPPASRLR